MKAARIHEYGPPEVLTLEDVPKPELGPKDLLIRVHASSVNPVDCKVRTGVQRAVVRLKLPWILGMDVSGVVEEVGEKVSGFNKGDEVWSSPTHRRQGTYCEWVAVDASAVSHKPKNLSHLEAASMPLVALTAWDCLVEAAKLQAGEKVLIHAGAGGVGSIAIQLAKHLGAEVATTCSGRNVEFVRGLGADVVVDYTQEEFSEVLSDYDVVLECMGGDIYKRSLKVLKRGGRIASINSDLPSKAKKYGAYLGVAAVAGEVIGDKITACLAHRLSHSMVVRTPSQANLKALAELVESEKIRPEVAKVFPLEEIQEAHRACETGRTRGKNVIEIAS